ncbi:MAG TPA: SDR family NAD(P)-dependent oxidoreductase [Puia sp.]|nr:SDR family NAD(P)-dependent oxidoreductase [Puia sp.]
MAYALVSGGSKGIGYAIAAALAKRKFDLILVARNTEELGSAKTRLESEYQIKVEILPFDLGMDESADAIGTWCNERDLPLKILCNVLGIGGTEDYLSAGLADTRHMLRLNTEPAVALIFNLLPLLKKNNPSYILNVSSMAGFAPIAVKNIYSATKSAVVFFSYSLRYQLKKDKISVSCLCPGPVFTKDEIQKDTIKKLGWFGKQMAVPADIVGEIAVRNTLKGQMLIVPGVLAYMVSVIIRLLPRRLISSIYYRFGSKK